MSKAIPKLLFEEYRSSNIICEEVDGKKKWFFEGVFLQAEVKNKNGRVYPEFVMDKAVGTYKTTYLANDRAVGELNHPQTLAMDLERISHKIVEMRKDGLDYYGKAVVLEGTPKGRILIGLLEGGVKVGVSSRGFGTTHASNGSEVVNDDYTILAIDSVFNPSAPDAFVKSLMENEEWVWDRSDKDVQFLESIRADVMKSNRKLLEDKKFDLFSAFLKRMAK